MNIKNNSLNFSFLLNIFFFIILFFGGLVWADTNGVWHKAEDIVPGKVGFDQGAGVLNNFTFLNLIYFEERTTFKSISTFNSNAIFQENIGIGTTNPTERLDVIGEIKLTDSGNQVCDQTRKGVIRWDDGNNTFIGCNGNKWVDFAEKGCSGDPLAFGEHCEDQCLTLQHNGINGTVQVDSNGEKFCKFKGASCPAGWYQYESWSTTLGNSCSGGAGCGSSSCSVPGHSWSNSMNLSCSYYSGGSMSCTGGYPDTGDGGGFICTSYACSGASLNSCKETITQIGCY